MYLLPSTSTSVAPEARLMNSGDSPTDLNARTGLSTPPGSSCCARAKSFCDAVVFMGNDIVASRFSRTSIWSRMLHVIDDDDGHRGPLALKRDAELLAKNGEDAWAVRLEIEVQVVVARQLRAVD